MRATLRHNRWWTLAAALLVEAVSGTFYAYSLYSPALRQRFSLSQDQIDLLGTMLNWGGNIGVHIGFFFNSFGARWTLALALFTGVPCRLLLWAMLRFFTGWAVPFWVLAVMMVVQGHSQLINDVTVVSIVAQAFPEHRGRALGLAKGFIGLSGSMVACVYMGVYSPDVVAFMLYLPISFGICVILAICFLRLPPSDRLLMSPDAALPRQRLTGASIAVGVLTAVLMGGSLLNLLPDPTQPLDTAATAAAAAVFLGLLAYLCRPAADDEIQPSRGVAAVVNPAPPHPAPPHPESRHEALLGPAGAAGGSSLSRGDVPACGPDEGMSPPASSSSSGGVDEPTLFQAIISVEALLMFALMTFAPGAGLMLINNLDSIHTAKGGVGDSSVLVSLVSTSNCAGRLLAGFISDAALYKKGWPRPFALAAANALMAGAMLALLLEGTWPIYAAAFLGGLSYGAINSLFPACASEIFGLSNLAVVYPAFSMGLALGSWAFATSLYSAVFDAALARHGVAPGGACTWSDCYALSAIVSAACCVLGAACSVLIALMTRQRYRTMLAAISKRTQTSTMRAVLLSSD